MIYYHKKIQGICCTIHTFNIKLKRANTSQTTSNCHETVVRENQLNCCAKNAGITDQYEIDPELYLDTTQRKCYSKPASIRLTKYVLKHTYNRSFYIVP